MRLASYWVIAAAVLISSPSARGAEVLDQSNDTSPSAFADSTSGSYQEQAQTFTVGVNGTLSRIAVQIVFPGFGVGGSAILTVYSTAGGVPNASLGTASISSAGMPSGGYAYQSFDVSSYAIPVHVGDVLAYGVTSTTDSYFLLRSTGDHSTYAGGQEVWRVRNPTGAWGAYAPSRDLGFQAYVLAAPAGLLGDFNSDGKVDAGDYVTWRKNNNTSNSLANDNGLGVPVGTAHYNLWRANFGKPPGSGSSLEGAAVPDPATLPLAIASCGCLCGLARRKV
jgi:hypothetical protein